MAKLDRLLHAVAAVPELSDDEFEAVIPALSDGEFEALASRRLARDPELIRRDGRLVRIHSMVGSDPEACSARRRGESAEDDDARPRAGMRPRFDPMPVDELDAR